MAVTLLDGDISTTPAAEEKTASLRLEVKEKGGVGQRVHNRSADARLRGEVVAATPIGVETHDHLAQRAGCG